MFSQDNYLHIVYSNTMSFGREELSNMDQSMILCYRTTVLKFYILFSTVVQRVS